MKSDSSTGLLAVVLDCSGLLILGCSILGLARGCLEVSRAKGN